MYDPVPGDEITFTEAAVNRDVVYTVTEVNDVEVTITTPKGYDYLGDVFSYSMPADEFRALGPRPLPATRVVR